ncbi:hypothetical protein M5689_011800 [Euphorbia peplus]|nr:hypothetical protein M5689_011800 [Euphorbia peplus]
MHYHGNKQSVWVLLYGDFQFYLHLLDHKLCLLLFPSLLVSLCVKSAVHSRLNMVLQLFFDLFINYHIKR